ncbi:lipopolysaccharide assembly protein LapA domain-containing protein [Dokdonella ginsengisoli]|uniref:Lipopolysaccharide assembly protein LapA domain-containing protein n=1 Tax=Dokdonella ginsengisoli TaxID=363846 RepID=A0ABV9R0S9_9GAMM
MRLILILSILLVVVAGAWFGALNATSVDLDFHFFRLQAPVGFALLAALLIGWLLGGLAAVAGPVPRLRRELRRLRQELRETRAAPPAKTDQA